jgi:hypothetical protein
MTKQIEVTNISGVGFKPLVGFGQFQIAVLTYLDELKIENIGYVEAHLQTDEVFMLMEGKCHLITADVQNGNITGFNISPLEKGKLYNVKQNTYHHHVLSGDAKVLIVENINTNYTNSHRLYFHEEQRKMLKQQFDRTVGGKNDQMHTD